MLKGKNIYKSFDNIEVLKDINIEIERGKIVSIVGKSGAGKSTLLYILSTLDKATNGEVLFDNKKLDELGGGDLQRLSIAIACQKDADLYLFDEPSSYNDV